MSGSSADPISLDHDEEMKATRLGPRPNFWGDDSERARKRQKREDDEKIEAPSHTEYRKLKATCQTVTFSFPMAELSVLEDTLTFYREVKFFGRSAACSFRFKQAFDVAGVPATAPIEQRWRAADSWLSVGFNNLPPKMHVVVTLAGGADDMPADLLINSKSNGVIYLYAGALDGFVPGDQLNLELHFWEMQVEDNFPGIDASIWNRVKDGTIGDLQIAARDGVVAMPSFLMETLFPFFRVRAASPVGSSTVQRMQEPNVSKELILSIIEISVNMATIQRPNWSRVVWMEFVCLARRWLVSDHGSKEAFLPSMGLVWQSMDAACVAQIKTFRDAAEAEELLEICPELTKLKNDLATRRKYL